MNKKQALDKIKELQEYVENLEAKDKWPEGGDYYNPRGCLLPWDGDIDDIRYAVTGTALRTQKEASTWMLVAERAYKLRGDWRADWGDGGQEKYYLVWLARIQEMAWYEFGARQNQGTFYMPEHACKQLIEEFTPEELKVFICGGSA